MGHGTATSTPMGLAPAMAIVQAADDGRRSYAIGASLGRCPDYADPALRQAWIASWREAETLDKEERAAAR